MDLFQTIILALIQGLTEFLPVSSSAHLILPSLLFGWPDQGLVFDVAVHIGTLLAVIIYFRKDVSLLLMSWLSSCAGLRDVSSQQREYVRLGWQIVVATIPAVCVAFMFGDFIEAQFRSLKVIATITIVFGLLLGFAEWRGKKNQSDTQTVINISWAVVIGIGIAQAIALIPGASRSGVTITAAVLLGLSRTQAARFSFLISIPVITAAGLYAALDIMSEPQTFDLFALAVGVIVSGISAWCCIALFLKLIERIGLMPFVWYRLLLGATLFLFIA